jgi:hypothetical protein
MVQYKIEIMQLDQIFMVIHQVLETPVVVFMELVNMDIQLMINHQTHQQLVVQQQIIHTLLHLQLGKMLSLNQHLVHQ